MQIKRMTDEGSFRQGKPRVKAPSGWLVLKDAETKRKYYHNTVTGDTTWKAPTKPAIGFIVGGAELPEGWLQLDDSETGNVFYHNLMNNAVTWTRPIEAATAEMDDVVPTSGGSIFTYSKMRAELKHYWLGCKLLVVELQIASGVLSRILQGHALTRREHKQLVRTVADVFRLVPFAIFVIIPFMEFLLPFAIKLFPNMLPSTFQDQLKEEEKLKQSLKLRMNMAEFLQDTLTQMAKDLKTNAGTSPPNHKHRLMQRQLRRCQGCAFHTITRPTHASYSRASYSRVLLARLTRASYSRVLLTRATHRSSPSAGIRLTCD
jgi:hypothetical protein